MQPSVTMCRAQEAHQRSLAANAVLPNVRAIATLAAAAWAKEAAAAEKREARTTRTKQIRMEGIVLHLELHGCDDRAFSENPDRGHAETDMRHR